MIFVKSITFFDFGIVFVFISINEKKAETKTNSREVYYENN